MSEVLAVAGALVLIITALAAAVGLAIAYGNKHKLDEARKDVDEAKSLHEMRIQENDILLEAIKFERMERERSEVECGKTTARLEQRIETLESGVLDRIEAGVKNAIVAGLDEVLARHGVRTDRG